MDNTQQLSSARVLIFFEEHLFRREGCFHALPAQQSMIPLHRPRSFAMAHQSMQTCIDACYTCALACDHCASECLQEDDVKMMARCIALNVDCAAACRTAAEFMGRGSELSALVCTTCAEVCDACAEECERHDTDHCRECASACRRCADECRRMSTQASTRKGRGSGAAMRQ